MATAQKHFEMVQQMQRNNADLAEYMRGLKSWGEDIEEQDQALSRQKPVEIKAPLRNQTKEAKEKKEKEMKARGKAPRSYKEWDKFDIDKELDSVDNCEKLEVTTGILKKI